MSWIINIEKEYMRELYLMLIRKKPYDVEDFLDRHFQKADNKERFLKIIKALSLAELKKYPARNEFVKEWLTTNVQSEVKSKRTNYTKAHWFFIGLKFANGEMDKLLEKHKSNHTQIANELGNETGYRPYISATTNKNKGDKNIYSSINKLEKIQTYCREHNIETTAFFKGRIKHFNLNQ